MSSLWDAGGSVLICLDNSLTGCQQLKHCHCMTDGAFSCQDRGLLLTMHDWAWMTADAKHWNSCCFDGNGPEDHPNVSMSMVSNTGQHHTLKLHYQLLCRLLLHFLYSFITIAWWGQNLHLLFATFICLHHSLFIHPFHLICSFAPSVWTFPLLICPQLHHSFLVCLHLSFICPHLSFLHLVIHTFHSHLSTV